MYKLKHKFLLLSSLSLFALIIVYLYGTSKSISNGHNQQIVGNTYVSLNLEFSYEFNDETTLTKYTSSTYEKLNYNYEDGVYFIEEREKTVQAIVLNKGNGFYIESTNTYMYLIN